MPSGARPRASGTPPAAVASTGVPRIRASVTTMPKVSARDGRTSRSAAAYSAARGSPVSGPVRCTRSSRPCRPISARTRARCSGSRPSGPTQRQVQVRSATAASAPASRSWPLRGVSEATHSSRVPACVPGASGAGSVPGVTTWTRPAGSACRSAMRRAAQGLVATTAAAARRVSRSRASSSRAAAGSRPVSSARGRCTRTAVRSRRVCGTTISGTPQATSPSSRTTAPSGTDASTLARAWRAAVSGRGHVPRTGSSRSGRPAAASVWLRRRS